MHLYKRGNFWWLEWWDEGVRHRESTKCRQRKAADIFLARRERELADPTYSASDQATIASAAGRFLRELRASCKSDGTFNMYECKARHVVRLLGTERLSRLTHAKVLGFTHTREAEGAASYTIHRELTTLRRILKSAAREREFGADVKSVIPEYSARYVPRTRWVTEDELVAVCRELQPGRAAALAFVVATSARRRELRLAQREDLRPEGIYLRGSKTARSRRLVPYVSLFWPLIAHVRAHADGTSPALFRPWVSMRRDVLLACKRAGVAPFTTNDLRRTTATWLVKRGVPLNLVAKVLGHASTRMLELVYGQLDASDVGRLIERHAHASA